MKDFFVGFGIICAAFIASLLWVSIFLTMLLTFVKSVIAASNASRLAMIDKLEEKFGVQAAAKGFTTFH